MCIIIIIIHFINYLNIFTACFSVCCTILLLYYSPTVIIIIIILLLFTDSFAIENKCFIFEIEIGKANPTKLIKNNIIIPVPTAKTRLTYSSSMHADVKASVNSREQYTSIPIDIPI